MGVVKSAAGKVGSGAKKAAVGVGVGALAVGSLAVAAPVISSVTIGHKTRNKLENALDSFGDDLYHLIAHGMAFNHMEEGLANRGHERCAAAPRQRPLPQSMFHQHSSGHSGPDF